MSNRHPLISCAIVVLLTGCRGDGTDNLTCEESCVEHYASRVADCDDRMNECLSSCTSFDDYDCVWDCEDLAGNCQMDFTRCIADCPCADRVVSCARNCPQSDTACLMDCNNGYLSCTENLSPYNCALGCQSVKSMCFYDCETAADMTQYTNCLTACSADEVPCLDECTGTWDTAAEHVEDPANEDCERTCAAGFAASLPGCEEQIATCLAGCTGPDDSSCVWDCETAGYSCQSDFSLCMSACPCLTGVTTCQQGCDGTDAACTTDCSDSYYGCAGYDSIYLCSSSCSAARATCEWECEDTWPGDMAGYISCRQACSADEAACVTDCAAN